MYRVAVLAMDGLMSQKCTDVRSDEPLEMAYPAQRGTYITISGHGPINLALSKKNPWRKKHQGFLTMDGLMLQSTRMCESSGY